MTYEVLAGLLALSLLSNIGLFIYSVKFKKIKKTTETYDVKALLHDLTAYDNAMVRVERVDPANILIRSPRESR